MPDNETQSTGDGGAATLDLIQRARAGDREAYDRLFAQVRGRVEMFIRLRLGRGLRSELDSSDVLQEGYLQAHRAFARFRYRGVGSFAAWVCALCENRIRGLHDHFDAKKRRPPPGRLALPALAENLAGQATGPASAAGRREQHARLELAVRALEPELREVILLKHFQERSVDQIAELLAVSPATVRRRLGRATVRLGAELGAAESQA